MIKERRMISWIIVLSLCISFVGVVKVGTAAQETISITAFYNNGVFGSGYEKALSGAVVTISNTEEMRIFFKCLDNQDWTDGISFRQEADISFSNCTFSYDNEKEMAGIYSEGKLLGVADRKGNFFQNFTSSIRTNLLEMGLEDAYIERTSQLFSGEYDGQGYSVSGFILSGFDTLYNGFFGHITKQSVVSDLTIKNCFLMNACGVFTGLNRGVIKDCSVEYMVGIGWWLGGIAESTDDAILRCKLVHSTFVNSSSMAELGLRMGGIAGSIYGGEISDCAVENSQIFTYDSVHTCVGGIVGYQNMGRISSCASFSSCSIPRKGKNYIAGGIVGYIESYDRSEVYNCLSAGKIAGGIVGGLVGKFSPKEGQTLTTAEFMDNSVSLSALNGNVMGGLVGELEEGSVFASYYYDVLTNSEAVGRNISGAQRECYAVNQKQIFGHKSAGPIGSKSSYSNTPKLLEALNAWVADRGSSLEWKAGLLGYPVLMSQLKETPAGNYELGSEVKVDTLLPNIPDDTLSPLPSGTPEASISPLPLPSDTPETSPSPDTPFLGTTEEEEQSKVSRSQLAIKDFKVDLTNTLQVKLAWKKNKCADGYQILRSEKKSVGYKVLENISATRSLYIDKKVKRGQVYYYKVRAYNKNLEKTIYGKEQKKKIQVAWYEAPVLRLSKGLTPTGKAYLQVGISKYSGYYIEVYFKTKGIGFIKAPLKSERIASYNGKMRFSYQRKSVLYCKVRTYQIKKGKKCYSIFSKEKKIQL